MAQRATALSLSLPFLKGQQIAYFLGKNYKDQSFAGKTISNQACIFSIRFGDTSPWITGAPHFTVSFPDGGLFDHDKTTQSHQFAYDKLRGGSSQIETWSATKLFVFRMEFGQLGDLKQISYGTSDRPFEDGCVLEEPIQLPERLD